MSAPGAGSTAIAELSDTSWVNGLLIYHNSGIVRAGMFASVAATSTTNVSLLDGRWHHIAVTLDGSTKTGTMYIDGQPNGTPSGPAAWVGSFPSTCRLALGAIDTFTQVVAEHSTWLVDIGHAWSAAQVLSAYNGQPPATVTHSWPLDDGAGTSARATAGGLAMTLSGGAAFSADSPRKLRGAVQNGVAYSEDVSASGWSTALCGVTAYASTLPTLFTVSGAKTLTDSGGAGVHQLTYLPTPFPLASPDRIILSCFVKRLAGNDYCAITLGGGATGTYSYFNINAGVPGTVISESSGIVDAGNGWWRIWIVCAGGLDGQVARFWFANSTGTAVSYTSNGSSVAITGWMKEIAAPGQTTPSPYVATGAAPLSVYGRRETRQNWLIRSGALATAAAWTAGTGVTMTDNTADLLAPDGTQTASKLSYNGTGGSAGNRLQQSYASNPPDQPLRLRVWMRTLTGTRAMRIRDYNNQTPTIASFTVTSTWTPIDLQGVAVTGRSGAAFILYDDTGVNSSGDVYLWHPQVNTGSSPCEYIATTGAPANSNGAPRGAA